MSTSMCELLVRAGQGDRDAFAAVYDATCLPMHRLALCLTGDPGRGADLLRDGYLEAWRTAPRFDPARSRALPWLMATMQHVAAVRQEEHGFRRAQRGASTTTDRGRVDFLRYCANVPRSAWSQIVKSRS